MQTFQELSGGYDLHATVVFENEEITIASDDEICHSRYGCAENDVVIRITAHGILASERQWRMHFAKVCEGGESRRYGACQQSFLPQSGDQLVL